MQGRKTYNHLGWRSVVATTLCAMFIGITGCGNDFLGLEDYQRDLLGPLLIGLLNNQPQDNTPGQSVPGADGVSCWDTNSNGVADAEEDVNGDGDVNVLDCQGASGSPGRDGTDGVNGSGSGSSGVNCWDLNSNGLADADEDTNGDGMVDVLDCRGADGTNGSSGSSGSTGPAGADGPSFFDIFVDDFFTAGEAGSNVGLRVEAVVIDEPFLGVVGGTSVAFRVAIPQFYQSGNDVSLRLFFHRTDLFAGDCFVFTLDARRLRRSVGLAPYGQRRWIRVDSDVPMTAGQLAVITGTDDGLGFVVDLPINTPGGLNFAGDLAVADLLAFELATNRSDGGAYQLLAAEFFESTANSAQLLGAEVFASEVDVVCATDCNGNGLSDELDIINQTSADCNGNGTPDECDFCSLQTPGQVAGTSTPFTFLQVGFTQEVFASSPGFMGGVAFAPDGDVLVDACPGPLTDRAGSSLRRFDAQTTFPVNGTDVHPQIDTLPSNAGCGLTNHVDGTLYSNTGLGVTNLDADTGVELRLPFGPAGNGLGIAPDPITGRLVYVGADGTLQFVDAGFTTSGVFSSTTTGALIDGIAFEPTQGNFLFLANRDDHALTILDRKGDLVQRITIDHDGSMREPDGIAFHATAPRFVVSVNLDGTITRFDFPGDDFTQPPTQSLFASGGFRGDLIQVGLDGRIYLTQNKTRFGDGTVSNNNSVVRICCGFEPPVVGEIALSPIEATNRVGTEHTVIATLVVDNEPIVGQAVLFEVLTGPNVGVSGSVMTDAGGIASFTYVGTGGVGTDELQASFEAQDGTRSSNVATKTWVDCSMDCNENMIPDECETELNCGGPK